MTPLFSALSDRLTRAKFYLMLTLTITVFCFLSSLVLGISYFAKKKDIYKTQRDNISQLKKLDELKTHLTQWQKDQAELKLKGLSPQALEKIILTRLTTWQDIINVTKDIHFDDRYLNNKTNVFSDLRPALTEADTTNWHSYLQIIDEQKNIFYTDMDKALKSLDTIHKEFILIGFSVLIFGILIPYFIFRYVSNVFQKLRKELEHIAYDFIKAWSTEKAKMGDQAFKNIEFWLKIMLTFGTHSGRMSGHPMAQMLGEISFIVNTELSRLETESKPSPPNKKTDPKLHKL